MNDTVIHQIVILSQGGASIRRIAQSLHISRRTVRRALEQHQQARTAGPPGEMILGSPMPLTGGPLTLAQMATIRDWITGGAPDN